MNSIRESCRSIEELDLGGNKLTDLIEIYKIIQCAPNLKFLNLSENDLSRTAPVSMASNYTCPPTIAAAYSTSTMSSNYLSAASTAPSSQQRSFLAPLNQNTAPNGQTSSLGSRRHSTLGQSTSSSRMKSVNDSSSSSSGTAAATSTVSNSNLIRIRQNVPRVAEARRLAAANALAQSKKTSSTVATKLANSAVASSTSQAGLSRARAGSSKLALTGRLSSANQRHQTSPTSTMHLARSMSSLSAKDLRASSSIRLSSHRTNIRSDSRNSISAIVSRRTPTKAPQTRPEEIGADERSASKQFEVSPSNQDRPIPSSSSLQKLYVEPIAETEDIDMGTEQQLSPNNQATSAAPFSSTSSSSSAQIQIGGNNQQQGQAKTRNVTSNNCTTYSPPRNPYNNNTHSSSVTSTAATGTGSQMNSFRRTFESIRALALNNTGCQWRVVCSILSRMPNLEELHLSLNNYEKIDLEPNEFKHHSLKRLYLCNNPKLTNWEELDKLLVAFPSLEALSIANCNISQIPENLDRSREWRKLCGLNINGWPIKEWPVVERLNQLPSLIDLKCRNLEVLNSIDEPRHHLIARLPKLQRLNGSEIEEREDAEKAFIRFFMANSHLERPSRFHELMQIYGEISTVDVDVDLSPPSQARVRIIYLKKDSNDDIMMSEDFILKLMDNADIGGNNVVQQLGDGGHEENRMDIISDRPSPPDAFSVANQPRGDDQGEHGKPTRLFKDESQEIVALEVDLRQSVRKFKSNLATLFGLNGQDLILYYIDHEMVGLMGPELLKHNQKKLWNYNVQDGDQFIVEER